MGNVQQSNGKGTGTKNADDSQQLPQLAITLLSARNLQSNYPSPHTLAKLTCSMTPQKYRKQVASLSGENHVFSDKSYKFLATRADSGGNITISFYDGSPFPTCLGKATIPVDPKELAAGATVERWFPIVTLNTPKKDKMSRLTHSLPSTPFRQNKRDTLASSISPLKKPPPFPLSPPAKNSPSKIHHSPTAPMPLPLFSVTQPSPTQAASKPLPEVLVRIDYSQFSKNAVIQKRDKNLTVDQFYEIGEIIGEGGFSTVRKAIEKSSKKEVAIKIIDILKQIENAQLTALDQGELDDFEDEELKEWNKQNRINILNATEQEIEIMQMLKHPNIVEFYEYFATEDTFYVVMELVSGGELLEVVSARGTLSSSEAALILKQLLQGVEYMHTNGIVHRDLKLENLLVDSSQTVLKITDFGLSKNYHKESLTTCVGSSLYVAPEVLLGEPYDNGVDIWSIGVMAYMLLSGVPPFDAPDDREMELFKAIVEGNYTFDHPALQNIGEEPKDFIRKALVVNPAERATAKELLEHPWIVNTVASVTTPVKPRSDTITRGVAQRLSQLNIRSKISKRTSKNSEENLKVVNIPIIVEDAVV